MDLNTLELFIAVADEGNFTSAAKRLGMERSTLSRRVAGLETELGFKLFHRTTRRVVLTTAGAGVYRDVAPLMVRLGGILRGIPERSMEPSGELRITAPVDIGTWVLPRVIAEFTTSFPRVFPSVELSNRVVDLEGEGFDMGLRISGAGRLEDSSLVVRKLGMLRNRLFAAPAYVGTHGMPKSLDELAAHRLVGLRGWRGPGALEALARGVETNDMALVRALTVEGVGLGLIPEFMARGSVDSGELLPILAAESFGEPTLFAVFPSTRQLPPKVTAFRDHLFRYCAEQELFE